VRPDLVVVLPPDSDGGSGLVQRLEPVLVQTLITKLAVEALNIAVLHWPPWFDQDVPNAMALRPGHEDAASEFRPVVSSHSQRISAEGGSTVEQTGDVQA